MFKNTKVKEALRKANILSKKYRWIQIFIAVLWGIIVLFSMITTIIYRDAIDSLILQKLNVSNWILILIIIAIFLSVLAIIINFLAEYLLEFTKAKIKGDLWENMLYKYLIKKPKEEILSKMVGDVEYVSQLSGGFIPGVSIQIIRIMGAALILIYLNIWLSLVVFVTSLAHVFLFKKLSPKVVESSFEERKAYNEIVEELREKVDGKYTIWKFFSADFFHGKFKKVRKYWTNKIKRLIYKEREYTVLSLGVGDISPWIVLFVGIYMIKLNLISVGTVVAVFYITPSIYEPLTNLSTTLAATSQSTAPIERVWASLEPSSHTKRKVEKREIVESISLNNVILGYEQPILKINKLEIKKGERIGVAGPSGVGKSTFIKTIGCLQKPLKGCVKINNRVCDKECKYENYNIYVVEEIDMLFKGTVEENICMGNSYSKKELERIVKICCIDDVKLDDLVELMGNNLSLGQRQRICLARALIRDPSLLIIDEALSGVDSERENKILKNIIDNFPQTTLVVVSHRLSTLLNMDKILVIYNERIEEVDKETFLTSEKYRFIKSQIIS